MGSAFYSWEKCFNAISILASGSGGLRERLRDAWFDSLIRLQGHPIPWPELREKFDDIGERLTPEISAGPEAVHRMHDDDLRKIASDILSLYDSVCREYVLDPNATEQSVAARQKP